MITIEPPSTRSNPTPLAKAGLTRFLSRAREAVGLAGEVEVLLTSDTQIKQLNRDFRGKNKPTDVLSFPAPEEIAEEHAGDLAISLDTAARQAESFGHSLGDEVRVLMLHGLLHLKGMDHEVDSGEMATRELELRRELKLPATLIERASQPKRTGAEEESSHQEARMSFGYFAMLAVLLIVLALAAYVDRVYSEMGKFLAREYQDNIDSWEQAIEPRLRLGRESIALSASVLRQLTLAAMALLWGLLLYQRTNGLLEIPGTGAIARAIAELILLILIFDRLIPQILFARTRGLWIRKITLVLQVMFYLILPVTIVLQLLLSIAALAEPEDKAEEEHPSEAMDALLEAGEEEGILEESDPRTGAFCGRVRWTRWCARL